MIPRPHSHQPVFDLVYLASGPLVKHSNGSEVPEVVPMLNFEADRKALGPFYQLSLDSDSNL